MGRGCSFLLLLLLLSQWPGAIFSLLRYRYDCGDHGMQLQAFPPRGRTVRFKVMDEFGTLFDVANCSICLHWLSMGADGAVVFSSGYDGCHVLVKGDRYVLRVQLEEVLLGGAMAAFYQLNMTCPKPGNYESLADSKQAAAGSGAHQTQTDVLVPLHRPGLLHHLSQSSLGISRPHLGPQGHSEQAQPIAHTQPVLGHPGLQPQPALVHPGLPARPGQAHLGLHTQTQQGLTHPGRQPQAQPGLLSPAAQSQSGLQTPNRPGLLSPGAQTQPGLLQPGFRTQNQLGLVHHSAQFGSTHTGAQTQASFIHSGAQAPDPHGFSPSSLQTHSRNGLLHPGLQTQAGLVPRGDSTGAALQSRPGLVRPGLQAQLHPGLERPRLQPQAQPGFLRPGLQSQASLLQSTALFYPSAGAGRSVGWGTQLTREQCQVAAGKMPCVAPQGREACLQAGCCYNDMDRVTPCYYGNTATVQCLLDGHFVVVVPRGLGTQPYNLDSVRLASSQPGCEPLGLSEAFVMFRFAVTQCGTTLQVIEDQLIYENQLISTLDVQGSTRGSITRDSIYILQARCIYNASDLLPLHMEVAVPPTSIPLAMLGPLGLQLRIATDETYSSYHPSGDYPLVKVLRDPIYVEVRLLQKTDPNLVLVLHQCWAAPSANPAAEPQWPILVDGCPFTGDNYRTQLIPLGPASPQLPFPSHYQRFAISTFTFVEPPSMAALEGEVYISCSASVCHLAQTEPCRPSCQLGVPSRKSGGHQLPGEPPPAPQLSVPTPCPSPGARRSPEDEGTAEAMAMVTSQGGVIFPKVPKLPRG
ncbi:ZP1 protein, partial [Ramphastos sulfuratus]|nr:ZP1 protein [Ramphastos sulfuratus]